MCGIAGQIRYDSNKVDQQLLEKFSNLLAHRGLDNIGYYINNNIGLMHRRLSIIERSEAGHQPMFINEGQLGIIFDGAIFNYIELRDELHRKGYSFTTNSDTEVLLKCYKAYGLDMLKMIEGMFAFALLDLEKHKIFLVRDRMGIKPLYYYQDSKSITFASEIKAIVKAGVCSAEIDPYGLCDYIHTQLYTQDHTLFKDIKSIYPGTYLEISLNNNYYTTYQYWDLPEEESVERDYSESINILRNLIEQAVKLWSRSDVTIGAYVSGGLDSSLVAALAQKNLNYDIQDNLLTFSSVFPDAAFPDERQFSDSVANHIKSSHNRVSLPKEEVIEAHENLLYVLDMPIAGYSAPYSVLSGVVRKQAKAVLTGHGGDELFCGYPKYIAAAIVRSMNQGLKGVSNSTTNLSNLKYIKGFEQQAKQIINNSIFSDDKEIIKSLFYRSEYLWKYINPNIRNQVNDYDVSESLEKIIANRNTSFLKKLLYLDTKILLPGLLHVEDRTSMIENLESRTPLLDRSIVEYSTRLPDSFFLHDGLKGMIRKAAEPLLPRLVTQNPSKSGTMYPAAELFDKEMKSLVERDLQVLDESGIFIKPVKDILGESKELVNRRVIWALWSLGAWIRQFEI